MYCKAFNPVSHSMIKAHFVSSSPANQLWFISIYPKGTHCSSNLQRASVSMTMNANVKESASVSMNANVKASESTSMNANTADCMNANASTSVNTSERVHEVSAS